jgi:hypothetical protein
MHDLDEEQDNLIRSLAPIVHVRTTPDETMLREIMGTPAKGRNRLRIAAMAGAALVASAIAVGVVTLPGKTPASALTIKEDAGYLTITIKDPAADPARYEAELKRRGLDIQISLAPARPEEVGKVVFGELGEGGRLSYIEDPGHCAADSSCTVGVKVPADFHSYARITFGRTPLPGEEVGTKSGGDAKTDALRGKSVAEVRRILGAQGKTILYRVGFESKDAPASAVPDSWKVYDAAYGTNNSVVIWVSEDGTAPLPPSHCGRAGASTNVNGAGEGC